MSEQQDFRIRFYERQAARLVEHLRLLADDVERQAKPYGEPGITGTPRYLAAAEAVNHALTWGIANAGAYRLFDAAHHADEAETPMRCHDEDGECCRRARLTNPTPPATRGHNEPRGAASRRSK